jgi:hypothetical protein
VEPWQGYRTNRQLVGAYGRQLVRNVVRPHPLRPADLWHGARPWWRSNRIHQQFSPISDRRPWMTFGAIGHLERELVGGSRVFEYGVGGSSVFFLDRGAVLASVESNPEWAAKVKAAVSVDWEVQVCPPEPVPSGVDEAFRSTMVEGSLRRYVEAIDGRGPFDVIVVDGFARNACLARAAPLLAPGGMLVLDNAERPHYAAASAQLDARGWRRDDYYGPGPYNLYFWRTTIWTAPPS